MFFIPGINEGTDSLPITQIVPSHMKRMRVDIYFKAGPLAARLHQGTGQEVLGRMLFLVILETAGCHIKGL